ncbi:hypothetical protein [Roseburia sp. 831b]|uniref:hypothetical protein n=1 Tax=Roseburia sp. 831b TaxID=1261635 RepID=UPI000951265D|nr:hypothetical protein [Roseburia sp. 831b]WVK74628.1 hypothetical protein BIV16_15110 [Roseburia sp. 831b]
MAKSKSVNSLDMFGNMAKLNTKPSRTKKDEGLTSNVVKKTYHVSFYNGEDVFFETELEEGNMIEAPHDKPQKASDEQFDYTFSGWDHELGQVKEDIVFHAEYQKTAHSYLVQFRIDGQIVETQNVLYGATPSAPQISTNKPDDEQYHYHFVKWEPELTTAITQNTDIQAIYSKELIQHTVTFLDEAGNELHKIFVVHGQAAHIPDEQPQKASDDSYDYQFNGWENEAKLLSVTDDITVKPIFEKVEKETVKFTEPETVTPVPTEEVISTVSFTQPQVNATVPMENVTAQEIMTPPAETVTETVSVTPKRGKVGRPATKKGIAKKVNVLFTEDTMEVINTAKVFFDGNMTKYLETLIMEDYKKNKDLYDTLAKTKRI